LKGRDHLGAIEVRLEDNMNRIPQ